MGGLELTVHEVRLADRETLRIYYYIALVRVFEYPKNIQNKLN